MQKKIFRFLASLKLAVISLLSLAAVLALATITESLYGMRAAHLMIYGSFWFTGLLGLLGINVLCAALIRYPWKRHQTGFVFTHLGILVILGGAFVTQRWGVDGNLPVEEGSEERQVLLQRPLLFVLDDQGRTRAQIPMPESGLKREGDLMRVQVGGEELAIDTYLPRAVPNTNYVESTSVGFPAVEVELLSSRFNVKQWLAAVDPDTGTQLALGPAKIAFLGSLGSKRMDRFLAQAPFVEKSESTLQIEAEGKQFRFPVEVGKSYRFHQALRVRIARFLPHAIVQNKELISKTPEMLNPAVQVEVEDDRGNRELHTVFSQFPEFTTLHGARDPRSNHFNLRLRLYAELSQSASGLRGKLSFAQSTDGKSLAYRLERTRDHQIRTGAVKLGEKVQTGWMDAEFRVARWISKARLDDTPRYVEKIASSESNFASAIRVRRGEDTLWLVEGNTRSLPLKSENLNLYYGKERLPLPFSLHLEKFTVGMDPGTTKAARYESEVVVKDALKGIEKRAQISMNEPLQYGGYTFYQASYQSEEGRPPVSVFAVNWDPGRWIKYAGSLIMVFGIILMFTMNPHYWNRIFDLFKQGKAS